MHPSLKLHWLGEKMLWNVAYVVNRAAAYVAMSRVQYDKDYLIAGPVCPRHFVPAH